MGRPGGVFAIGFGGDLLVAQEAADGIGTGAVAFLGQVFAEMPQAPPHPPAGVHWIAAGVGMYQLG